MNKREVVNISGPLEAEAVRILRTIPGLGVTTEPAGDDHAVDATLQFAGEQTALVAVQVKGHANPATAWQLIHHAETHPDKPLLLIAGTTTAEARRILEEHGIAFIDGLGNAHIELPGFLFHIGGRGRAARKATDTPPPRLRGKAGVVAQALLLHPERDWQIKDLAAEAHVSAGLVHRVLTRLEKERVVMAEGAGPHRVRRLAAPTALLDLWAEEDVERPIRTTAYRLAQTPRQLIRDVGHALATVGWDHALTGAAAATLVAPFSTAVPIVEVWVAAAAAPEDLVATVGADPVPDGHNLVFLQGKTDAPLTFREQVEGLWLANRFRLYADLRRDPRRGREQARHLRDEVIGF